MDIRVEVNPESFASSKLITLLTRSSWGTEDAYNDEKIQKMIKGCFLFLAAYNQEGSLVGYARVFSDDVSVTWLAEILVDPDHRGKGIGRELMREFLNRTMHTAIYAETFLGVEGFFKKFNLTQKPRMVVCSRKPLVRNGHPIDHGEPVNIHKGDPDGPPNDAPFAQRNP